ncbi:hypothetical protein BKA63DRAFT_470115 [Paraphoma chrysanthemicola]|nr:hypothetical protein BKA63DRAFT_470115 [Paraphoma chrysanthemicola]
MPGLVMDTSQIGVIPTPHNHPSIAADDAHTSQPFIKAEHGDTFGDSDNEDGTYKPRPQLPKPFVFMRSLAQLIKDLDAGLIDVDPEYQREVVWTADRMTGLIDSLMENFYIPPIILNNKTLPSPRNGAQDSIHVCVDGKQRLSSVRAFIKGMIPCHDHRGEKWWFCDTPSSRRKKVLLEETQKQFLAKELVSFEFKDLSPEQEEDLFARVQMGVQLSLAEKMRASTGPWQELARLFVDDFPIVYSLMKDRARAKDFQLTLSCFSQIIEVMHPTASDGIPILKTNFNALPKLLSNKSAVDDGIKSHLASVWNTFKNLIEQDIDTFTNANKYLRGVQTFAPVEMVAVAVMISMYSDTRNNQLLLGDIKALREAIRENFVDIRTNAPVWKFVWDFLENLEAIRGAVDGSTVDRRVGRHETSKTAAVRVPRPATATAPSPTVKRGRPTARTKPPSILPPQQLFTIKKEEGDITTTLDSRPPKRQRTDPSPQVSPTPVVERRDGSISGKQFQPPQFTSQPQFSPMPTHESSLQRATSTQLLPGADKQAPQAALSQRRTVTGHVLPSSAPVGRELVFTSNTHGTPARMPSSVPEVQRGCGSESSGLLAPTVPLPTSITPTQQSTAGHSKSVSSPVGCTRTFPPSHQRLTSNGHSTLRTGIGAFAPKHTEQQWAGEVLSSTPPTDPAHFAPSPPGQPARKPRKVPPRPTRAQYDGAIDLTSDTEQERQDLLSSFKASALAAKQKQAPSRPVVPPPQLQGASELPLRKNNNPYARSKDGRANVR